MEVPSWGRLSSATEGISNPLHWINIRLFYRAMSAARTNVSKISPSGSWVSTGLVLFVARVSWLQPQQQQLPLLLFALFVSRVIALGSVQALSQMIRSKGSHGCHFQWSSPHCDTFDHGGPASCNRSACPEHILPHSYPFTVVKLNSTNASPVLSESSIWRGGPVSATASCSDNFFCLVYSFILLSGRRGSRKGFLLHNSQPRTSTSPSPPISIRYNGGGSASAVTGAGSGGRSSSSKNGGVWGGFTFEVYGLVGIAIASIVVHVGKVKMVKGKLKMLKTNLRF